MTNKNTTISEPIEAFPYTPPTDEIKLKYSHIFKITKPLPSRFFKLAFDKLVAFILLFLSLPVFLLLKIAYIIEGMLIPENKGPMLFIIGALVVEKRLKSGSLD